MRRAFFFCAAWAVFVGAAGCRPANDTEPFRRCDDHCAQALPACDRESCARGCRVMIDRDVEGVARGVFACVADAKACSERTFARCAVRQGVHADGGPPLPPSYPEDD